MELQSNLNAVEAALSDFRKIYTADVDKADAMLANLQNQLEGLQATQKAHIEYLDECKEVGIIEKALRHDDVLEILKKRSKHHEDDVNLLQSKVISVGTMVANINDEMKKFPDQVTRCAMILKYAAPDPAMISLCRLQTPLSFSSLFLLLLLLATKYNRWSKRKEISTG
jgi:hypothetical protein